MNQPFFADGLVDINVELPKSSFDKILELCERQGIDFTQFVIMALEERLMREEEEERELLSV